AHSQGIGVGKRTHRLARWTLQPLRGEVGFVYQRGREYRSVVDTRKILVPDIWEYDAATPPILGEIKVDGKKISAVMAANKTGFIYVFDRKTGRPVWPIEEKPVPASSVPGEEAWPTQPFPSKPPAFDRQGVTEADLID